MWKQFQPTELIFGEHEADKLAAVLERYHADSCLLVADPFLAKSGLARKLMETSGGRIVGIFSEIEPNPTLDNIDHCVSMIRSSKSRFLLAVGGGSAMDCVKCAAAASAMDCRARDLMDGMQITSALPFGAVPTTAGTGSEVTAGAVLSDRAAHHKDAIFSPCLFAKFAIIDPTLTYTCPPSVTASSGIDVLMHAIDAMSSIKANPLTDTLAVRASQLVFQNLLQAVRCGSDQTARRNMSTACVLAGMAFSQTGTTGSHACSYALTEIYGIPHGEACAFTADAWLQVNAEARPALNDCAKEIGFRDAEDLADALNQLKRDCGFRTTLEEANIPVSDLDAIAASTLAAGNYVNNAAQLSKEEVAALLARYHA